MEVILKNLGFVCVISLNLLFVRWNNSARHHSLELTGFVHPQSQISSIENREVVTPRFHTDVGHMPLRIEFLKIRELENLIRYIFIRPVPEGGGGFLVFHHVLLSFFSFKVILRTLTPFVREHSLLSTVHNNLKMEVYSLVADYQ